jgi:Cu(I)/Ag(I) efflux system membrane protein CusA/SilA
MIEKIIKASINNRVIVIVASLFMFVSGLIILKKTPVDALPDLSDVQVIIKTSYPGQAPQVVEDQVTYPLASSMLSVPGATNVRAYSFFGDSYVYVLFADGTDPYWARSRVLEYLSQVSSKLPKEAKPELGPDATGVGWVYEYALVDKTHKYDLSELTSLQNWFLKYELQTVPGVSEVATIGGMVKQYQVMLSPNKLKAYNLTLAKVKMAIDKANKEVGGSVIEMAEAEYMVRAKGYLKTKEDFENIPLGVTNEGTPILLKNVATIRLGPQMRRGLAELNGEGESVGGVVVMRQGENALAVIQKVKERLKVLSKSLPKGVEIVPTYDRSSLIKRAITNLKEKLIEEISVVILICFIFLFHFRSALIIVFSLLLGVIGAFMIMYAMGVNANIMSLGGIAIAIGAMVDAAIVMIENAHKHFEKENVEGEKRWQVIIKAASEVGPSLFFSLLIITLSFLPIFSLQAQEGRLFSPLAFTKTFAMGCSAFLAITLVPVLMGYFIRGKITPEEKNPLNRGLIALYRPLIKWTLSHPWQVVVVTFSLIVITAYPYKKLGSEFMPNLNEGDLLYMPTTLPGISIGKARELLQQTDKLIKTMPEVKSVFGKVGRAYTATDPAPLTMIETVVQLKNKKDWRAGMTMEKIKSELSERVNVPGLTNAWVMPIKARIDMLATGIKTPVGIKISGPTLETIQSIGEKIKPLLEDVPGTASVYVDKVAGGRYIDIDIKRKKAARFGLNIEDVQQVVSLAVGGISIGETVEGRERYPINLRYPQKWRDSAAKLKSLPIVTPKGANIVLSDVADIKVINGPPAIKSENARLNGWVLVDIEGVDLGSYVAKAQKAIHEKLKLPEGYSLSWSGQYEYMERAKARLMYVLPLTISIIILMLYLNFKHVFEVAVILATLPLSLVGSIWFMYMLDYNLSIAVAVGMIALTGVAVEIGVVMLVYLNHALEHERSKGALTQEKVATAVINGALLRVRPIIMTVGATIVGLVPIMYGTGTGSIVMQRIAAPMVGGMVSATILALMLIPAIFYLRYRNSH